MSMEANTATVENDNILGVRPGPFCRPVPSNGGRDPLIPPVGAPVPEYRSGRAFAREGESVETAFVQATVGALGVPAPGRPHPRRVVPYAAKPCPPDAERGVFACGRDSVMVTVQREGGVTAIEVEVMVEGLPESVTREAAAYVGAMLDLLDAGAVASDSASCERVVCHCRAVLDLYKGQGDLPEFVAASGRLDAWRKRLSEPADVAAEAGAAYHRGEATLPQLHFAFLRAGQTPPVDFDPYWE